jgi:hypothetical protein
MNTNNDAMLTGGVGGGCRIVHKLTADLVFLNHVCGDIKANASGDVIWMALEVMAKKIDALEDWQEEENRRISES